MSERDRMLGIGAVAGAIIGATIGTLLLPGIGTIIGAILGSVVGNQVEYEDIRRRGKKNPPSIFGY